MDEVFSVFRQVPPIEEVFGVDSKIVVEVEDFATSGDGTESNPYTGWDSKITWTPGILYQFLPNKWYFYSEMPSGWNQSGMKLKGHTSTHLVTSSTSHVVFFDASATAGSGHKTEIEFGPFTLVGNNTDTAYGLRLRGVVRSKFEDIRVRSVSTTGILQEFGVLNKFFSPRVSENDYPHGTYLMPTTCMEITSRTPSSFGSDYSSTNIIFDPIMELNNASTGIKLNNSATDTLIIGGTCEGLDTGLHIGSDATYGARKTTIINCDLEFNICDIKIGKATNTTFINPSSISTPATVALTGVSGTFGVGHAVTWSGGGTASIQKVDGSTIYVNLRQGTWTNGATTGTLTDDVSGATGNVSLITHLDSVDIGASSNSTTFIGGQFDTWVKDAGTDTKFRDTAMKASFFKPTGSGTVLDSVRDYSTNTTLYWNQVKSQYVASASVTGTITVSAGTELLVLDNAALVSALTVAMPPPVKFNAGTNFATKTRIKIASPNGITTLTLTDPEGRAVGSPISDFTSGEWFYEGSGYKWIKVA